MAKKKERALCGSEFTHDSQHTPKNKTETTERETQQESNNKDGQKDDDDDNDHSY